MVSERVGPRKTHQAHEFRCRLVWTGGAQSGPVSYVTYSRDYRIDIPGKASIEGSAAGAFRGDEAKLNPEDLLVASLSACHCLSYLALCARAGVEVISYEDDAWGKLEPIDGKLRFSEVLLRPSVRIAAGASREKALDLHAAAHRECFIANSVNFPVRNDPSVEVAAS
jgi:organic hydroperoxide reductase OsmC/OhrA